MTSTQDVCIRMETTHGMALSSSCCQEISCSEPDWFRESPRGFFDPSRRLLRAIRKYQACISRDRRIARIWSKRWVVAYRFWTVVTASDIPINSQLGGGLLLPHPSGVVVHPSAIIGPNCLLGAHAVIGTGGKIPGFPTLAGHVDVGAGACVLGGVRLGEHSRVGANAVVIQDVPPGATAVGVPARIIQRKELSQRVDSEFRERNSR